MIRSLSTHRFTPRAHGGAGAVFSIVGLVRRIAAWSAIARQRRALARLDEDALRDIGLTRDEARNEAARPFWDAPAHWVKRP